MTDSDFESLYRRHFDTVYRFILKLSNDQNIAEEITSETFFKAIKTVDSFRGDCHINSWLCQIAKNSYYSYLRKNRETLLSEDGDFTRDTTLNVDMPRQEKQDALSLEERMASKEESENEFSHEAAPLMRIKKDIKEYRRAATGFGIFGVLVFILVLAGQLTRPVYVPYSQELMSIAEGKDGNVYAIFSEEVTDFSRRVYKDADK